MEQTSNSLDKKVGPLLSGDRPLPHNLDAEKAVLGCVLTEPDTLAEASIRLRFSGAFYSASHQLIFDTLVDMANSENRQKIDLITVSDRLAAAKKLSSVGGDAYLAELMNVIPTTANMENYVTIVHDYGVLRRLIKTSSDVVAQCFEADIDARLLLDKIQQEVNDVSNMSNKQEAVHIGDMVKEAIEHVIALNDPTSEDAKGIPTGFDALDEMITGLKGGEMFVLAARPSIGKTTFAMNMAANVAIKSNKAVAIFSLEMNTKSLVLRMLGSEAEVGMSDVRDGLLTQSRWVEITNAADRIRKAPIYIDDTGQLDIIELRAKARRMKEKYDIQFIVIDYLQLMKGSGGNAQQNREQEVAQISGGIKALAKEIDVPILILAQLNRQAEQGGGKPKLANLRESGSIEQDADIVGLLHRDREAMIEGDAKELALRGQETDLIIAKHRNGEVGTVPLMFFPSYTVFKDKSRVEDSDYATENTPINAI